MDDSISPVAPTDPVHFRAAVLEAILAGNEQARSIAHHIGSNGPETLTAIRCLLDDGSLWRDVEVARAKISMMIVRYWTGRGIQYAINMDKLTTSSDERVAFAANKDILDRLGTRPAETVKVSGLEQYKALMEELAPEKEKSG